MKGITLFETGEARIHLKDGRVIPTNNGYIWDDKFIELDFDNVITMYGTVEKIEDEYGVLKKK